MIIKSDFHPAWWLPGPHLQTMGSRLHRRREAYPYVRRERFELPDGDFIDVDWGAGCERDPLVLILHGLQGSSASPYARHLSRALAAAGFQAGVMHFRGCSGEPNRLARSYHSGETGDLAWLLEQLGKRNPHRRLFAVGYSLGGNVLLKWLGEAGGASPLAAAVAVSVPFDLAKAAKHLDRGFSRFYQKALLRDLKRSVLRKAKYMHLPVSTPALLAASCFHGFDDAVTAPLHGFAGADDYYRRSSCNQYLKNITVPTLIVHAVDDPFLPPDGIPDNEELSSAVTLMLSEHGGHVGFIGGDMPWRPCYWLDETIPRFLRGRMALHDQAWKQVDETSVKAPA